MKEVLVFLLFAASSVLAGIGIEEMNTTDMVFGLIFMVLAMFLVFCKNEKKVGAHG
jgi:hypothetical membrane protein